MRQHGADLLPLADDARRAPLQAIHMLRPRPTTSHVRHRLSAHVEVVVIWEAAFDALPKFCFAPGFALAGKHTARTAPHMTKDKTRIARFQFGCCLLRLTAPDGAVTNVLLDTGLGTGPDVPPYIPKGSAMLPLLATLRAAGLEPADIDLVVHSHMHGDHVGWNVRPAEAEAGEVSGGGGDGEGAPSDVPTFPRATHCVHADEWAFSQHEGCPWAPLARRKFGPLERTGQLRLLHGEEGAIDEAKARPARRRRCRRRLRLTPSPAHVCAPASPRS